MAKLEPHQVAEEVLTQLQVRVEIAGVVDAGQHVQERVKPRAPAPSEEVVGLDPQVAPVLAQLFDEGVGAPLWVSDQPQILVWTDSVELA